MDLPDACRLDRYKTKFSFTLSGVTREQFDSIKDSLRKDVAASVGSNMDLVTVAIKNARRRAMRSLASHSTTEVEATVASPTKDEGSKIQATAEQRLSLTTVEKSLAQEGVSLEVSAIESEAPKENEGGGDELDEDSAASVIGASALGIMAELVVQL